MHDFESTTDERTDDRLHECPVCGAVGLEERISNHDCQAFLARQHDVRGK